MRFIRKVWPKHSLADRCGFSFTHCGLTFIICFQWFTVLPLYHKPFTEMYCLHVGCGLFILFQVFMNLYELLLSDTTVESLGKKIPVVLQKDWYFCKICQLHVPPRAHHCPLCSICILKRDHHCMFTGNCVGHFNHRNFIMMVFYLWIGCIYTLLFNLDFYSKVLGTLDFTYIKLIIPPYAFLVFLYKVVFGSLNIYQFYVLLVSIVNIMAMFFFTMLLGFQAFFVSNGQTQFECKKKITKYSRCVLENWKVVLGSRWYLTFISAYVISPLANDGTYSDEFLGSTINDGERDNGNRFSDEGKGQEH